MDLRAADDSESRFAGYVEGLVSVIGHADCVSAWGPDADRRRKYLI